MEKDVKKPKIEIPFMEKKEIGPKSKAKGKSFPKNQRGPQVKHFCHHCDIQGHTRPNCFKLHALKRADSLHALKKADSLHAQGNIRRMPREKQAKGENDG